MTQLRWWCAALPAWLFLLFNIERLYGPLNLASPVYVLAALLSLAVILCPYALRLGSIGTLLITLALLLSAKYWLGYPIGRSALPITVTEYCALALTVLMARQVARGLETVLAAVFQCMISELEDRSRPFEAGQGHLFREVRRARHFSRPLALLAIAPQPGAVRQARDRFLNEMSQRLLHQYVTVRMADFLSRELKDCDLIAQRNRHFVALLPETNPDEARSVAQRLQAEARQALDLDLQIGVSTFPAEETTFVQLLERAETRMRLGEEPMEIQETPKPQPVEMPPVEEPVALKDTVVLAMDKTTVDFGGGVAVQGRLR